MKTIHSDSNATKLFETARNQAIDHGRSSPPAITWPDPSRFNWALDWFDHVPRPERCALIVVGDGCSHRISYAELSRASNRIANHLSLWGAEPGDRVLIMMRNSVNYYAVALACMKLGLPLVPVFASLQRAELEERIRRARIRHMVVDSDLHQIVPQARHQGLRIAVGTPEKGWIPLSDADDCSDRFIPTYRTRLDDQLMGYFTSGTTSRPKLVLHSHRSYSIGHLSSLYWHGIGRDDIHANVSAPGWAKHAWSSMFVPFSAEATALVFASDRPDPGTCLQALEQYDVTSFCAPPSYWRALSRESLGSRPRALRQAVSAGESLDAPIVAEVLQTWGIQIRDGYGQSEATAMIGFAPGQEAVPGGLGYALPGYSIKLIDSATGELGDEGEICLDLGDRPIGLMLGYGDDSGEPVLPPGRYYHTGDLARRDSRGCFHLLGRADDVFKTYDVRVSPVEIESILRTHPLVADVAVFAVTDEVGELVPAAALVAVDHDRAGSLSADILQWQRERLSQTHRLVYVWAVDQLPKTLSGKTNRAALRERFANATTGSSVV